MLNLLVGNKHRAQTGADPPCGDAVDKGRFHLRIIPFLIGVEKGGKENLFVKRRIFKLPVIQVFFVFVYPDFQLDILFDIVSAEKYRLLIQTDTWRQIDQPV